MLYGERKRLAEMAVHEAAGESFWTDTFDQSIRTKVVLAFRKAATDAEFYIYARELILEDEGKFFLHQRDVDEASDLINFFLTCGDHMVPTVIEAMAQALSGPPITRGGLGFWEKQLAFGFEPAVSVILREHRISYDLIDHQMLPFSARELHHDVLAPSLCLLAGRPDLGKVESTYRSALEEIAGGKSADAITDAGTALQEMLTSLGCDGNALGSLIGSAKSKGLLAPHDSPMLDAVAKVLHWVSADRSEKGDAHKASTATIDDAWFTVHVVGAIILRLSKTSPRAS